MSIISTLVSATSLLVALSVLLRDGGRERRRFIESVGAWAVFDADTDVVELRVRNTNALPVFAVHVEVGLTWSDTDPGVDPDWHHEWVFHRSVLEPGAEVVQRYSGIRPAGVEIDPLAAVRALSIVDTNGRRWRAHPGRAVTPKSVERIRPF